MRSKRINRNYLASPSLGGLHCIFELFALLSFFFFGAFFFPIEMTERSATRIAKEGI